MLDVTVSAASVTCSPTKASLKPSLSASKMASRSSCRVWVTLRPGGCKGIMKVLYFKVDPVVVATNLRRRQLPG